MNKEEIKETIISWLLKEREDHGNYVSDPEQIEIDHICLDGWFNLDGFADSIIKTHNTFILSLLNEIEFDLNENKERQTTASGALQLLRDRIDI